MQQDIKNQILNILTWTRASGAEISKSLKTEIEQFLSEKGVPMRGPAFIALIESLSPKASQFLLQSFKLATEPMHLWLGAKIDLVDNNRVSLIIDPKPHLIEKVWNPSVFGVASQEATKVLLERICPPGPLEIRTNKMDLQILFHCHDPLFIRLEIEPPECETFLRELVSRRQTKLHVVVNVQNHHDRGIAQVGLDLEVNWSPLVQG